MTVTKEERVAYTNALMCVLPYPRKWYDGLADKRLKAIYRTNLSKIIDNAIKQDDIAVRRKFGLPVYEDEQLALPL